MKRSSLSRQDDFWKRKRKGKNWSVALVNELELSVQLVPEYLAKTGTEHGVENVTADVCDYGYGRPQLWTERVQEVDEVADDYAEVFVEVVEVSQG